MGGWVGGWVDGCVGVWGGWVDVQARVSICE